MGATAGFLNRAVTALGLATALALPAAAQQAGERAPALPPDQAQALNDLKSDDYSTWAKAQSDLLREWSNSGSPAMDLLLERGQAAMKAGDYPTAIAHLTALIDHAPDFEDAYNARAQAYFHQGMFGPAVQDLGRALTLNPYDFRALAGLGTIFEDMDKPKDALAAFEMARAIHPHLPEILNAIKQLKAQSAGQEL